MSDRTVWFIGKTANPEEAYDSEFYSIEKVAREHCRNLVGNGWPGYHVYEARVTMAARTPDSARLLAAAKDMSIAVRGHNRDWIEAALDDLDRAIAGLDAVGTMS